jgi:tetratricopeptide (TPR) repeat protein
MSSDDPKSISKPGTELAVPDRSLLPVEVVDNWKPPGKWERLLRTSWIPYSGGFCAAFVPDIVMVPIIAVGSVWGLAAWLRERATMALADSGSHDRHLVARHRQLRKARWSASRLESLHDLGYAHLRAGNYAPAISAFLEINRLAEDFLLGNELRTATMHDLALAYTCAGELDSACLILDQLKDGNQPAATAALIRLGDLQRAPLVKFSSARWLPRVRLHNKRVYRLLRCFAFEQLGHPPDQLDLDRARPKTAYEYSYLTKNWPELEAFVVEHALEPRGSGRGNLPRARALAIPERLLESRG